MTDGATALRAHAIVRAAVASGDLAREACEDCGAEKTEGHHDDYSKPLDVRWLCKSCHKKWHRLNPSGVKWDLQYVKLTPELADAMRQSARNNSRFLHAEIRWALKWYLKQQEETK